MREQSNQFKKDVWMNAFESCGIDYTFYILRERKMDELFFKQNISNPCQYASIRLHSRGRA